MTELRDCTPLLDDPDALRARLIEDGHLFFRGLLDRAPLDALRSDILRTVAGFGWTQEGTDPEEAIPSQPPRFHAGAGWREGYIAIQRLERFHAQAHEPRVIAVLEKVLGRTDVLVHGQRIARVIWPSEPNLTTPPHQDYTHIQGTADVLTTWVPLSDCPRELGGLRVLTGSHAGGIRPVVRSTGAGGVRSLVDDDDPRWSTTDFAVGDLVMFHSFLVHAGQPNVSDRLRVSVDYRYQSASDPVAIQSIRPHNCPYVPDWPELLDGVDWATDRWCTVPDGLEITEVRLPRKLDDWHEELQPVTSRLIPA